MAEPFVFHFSPDRFGRPEVMYVVDLRLVCGLCKHPQLQRFYHALPFHTLTLRALEDLLDSAAQKGGYVCENCGEQVGPEHVVAAALTYGFPDESGVLVGLKVASARGWRFEPRRRLDPQRLPAFETDGLVALEDTVLEAEFGRVFSAKTALLELVEGDEPGWMRVAADMAWMMCPEDELEAWLDEIEDELDPEDALFVALEDSRPDGIGTHQENEKLTGNFRKWLPTSPPEFLLGAFVDSRRAIDVFERVLEVARLSSKKEMVDEFPVWKKITTPGGVEFPHEIRLESILKRAVFTGITPGESARLTGEELAGILLRVWKSEVR